MGVIDPLPQGLIHLPIGTYGISFNLFTTDSLPDGWGLRSTSSVYRRIRNRLEAAGLVHTQGSLYQRDNTFAAATWAEMMELRSIEPLGIIPSSLGAIQMFAIPLPVMIATEAMQLGGEYSPNLIGPTPANLVPDGVPFVLIQHPPDPFPVNVVHNAHSQ